MGCMLSAASGICNNTSTTVEEAEEEGLLEDNVNTLSTTIGPDPLPFYKYDFVNIRKTDTELGIYTKVADFSGGFTLIFGDLDICTHAKGYSKNTTVNIEVSHFVGVHLSRVLEMMMDEKKTEGLQLAGLHLDEDMSSLLCSAFLAKVQYLSIVKCTGDADDSSARVLALFLGHESLILDDNKWTGGDAFFDQVAGLRFLEMDISSLSLDQASSLAFVPQLILYVARGVDEEVLGSLYKMMSERHGQFSFTVRRNAEVDDF